MSTRAVRAVIALVTVTLTLTSVGLATGLVPVRMAAVAAMGATISVDSRGDGSESLYVRSTDRVGIRCAAKRADGTAALLRSDMFAQPLPGSPVWRPIGGLIDAGRLQIICSGSQGGTFGVGPTRSIGYVLLLAALTVGAVSAALAAVTVTVVARREHRADDTHRSSSG